MITCHYFTFECGRLLSFAIVRVCNWRGFYSYHWPRVSYAIVQMIPFCGGPIGPTSTLGLGHESLSPWWLGSCGLALRIINLSAVSVIHSLAVLYFQHIRLQAHAMLVIKLINWTTILGQSTTVVKVACKSLMTVRITYGSQRNFLKLLAENMEVAGPSEWRAKQ